MNKVRELLGILIKIFSLLFCIIILVKCCIGIYKGEKVIDLLGFLMLALDRLQVEIKKETK